jgi:hypothetical protein
MSTVIIQPRTFDEEVEATVELVQLRILTKAEDWEGLFDQIEVWRSTELPQGPYEELTGGAWLPARVPRTAKDRPDVAPSFSPSVYIAGLKLNVRVDDEEDFVITFAGPDPTSYATAVTEVIDQGAGRLRAYLTDEADFVIEGVRPGNGAQLEVTGGDAAVLLGLSIDSPENYGRGRDARMTLVRGKEQYEFTDLLGSKDYYYKTRFRNSTTNAVSDFSTAFSAGQTLGVSPVNIVCGYLDLVRSDGRPLANQLVQVYASVQTTLVEEKLVTGARQVRLTDVNGHIEFNLVRGVSYTISITGTDIVREVMAPTDSSVKLFNMLKDGIEDDAFKVQVPDIITAERRSL